MKKIVAILLSQILLLFSLGAEPEKVIILGSGPAGLTAAIYAARAEWSPLVIEGEKRGGQIILAQKLENYPGFPEGISGLQFIEKLNKQAKQFGARFMSGIVINIDLTVYPYCLTLDHGQQIYCESLIIATGTSPKWLGIPSEMPYRGKGVYSCSTCDGYKCKGKEVVVVGGGDIALHQAMALSKIAKNVTVIFEQTQSNAAKYLQKLTLECENVVFRPNSKIQEICDLEDKVTGIKIKNTLTDVEEIIDCQGVFVAIGRTPNTELFLGQINMDDEGYILLKNRDTKTNISGVFAAGNVADTRYHQTITAAALGCQAALDADEFLSEGKGP